MNNREGGLDLLSALFDPWDCGSTKSHPSEQKQSVCIGITPRQSMILHRSRTNRRRCHAGAYWRYRPVSQSRITLWRIQPHVLERKRGRRVKHPRRRLVLLTLHGDKEGNVLLVSMEEIRSNHNSPSLCRRYWTFAVFCYDARSPLSETHRTSRTSPYLLSHLPAPLRGFPRRFSMTFGRKTYRMSIKQQTLISWCNLTYSFLNSVTLSFRELSKIFSRRS